MKQKEALRQKLRQIDHKSYGMYKELTGSYSYGQYILHIDHVQGDPFASPSRLRLEAGYHGFPEEYIRITNRRIALEDQVLRRFCQVLGQLDLRSAGSGKSGRISICRPEQSVLERMAVRFYDNRMEIRFEMGFPARGRTILAREMEKLLFETIPQLAGNTLFYDRWEAQAKSRLKQAVELSDDQQEIRRYLKEHHYASFVADGAILPRESGVSDRPMKKAVPFSSPDSMRITIPLPHKGEIRGMGIPEGVTVIVGGGYHGKSTLLNALERGVYDHISGDGREYVISSDNGVKIRAEDGRSVKETDISLFIRNLPGGSDTRNFSSENASGSTSQAANVIEALEAGSDLLFLDEDTSATNFMIRDRVMAKLVPDEKEPIVTLLSSIRSLYEEKGVSFIIVIGSSGDYLSVADHVLMMDHYEVRDVTRKAKTISQEEAHGLNEQNKTRICEERVRIQEMKLEKIISPVKFGRLKMKASGTDSVMIDREVIDVRYLEQISENGQTTGLCYLCAWILKNIRRQETLAEAIDRLYRIIAENGLEHVITRGYPCGQPVLPRKQELYACVCRYRKGKMEDRL